MSYIYFSNKVTLFLQIIYTIEKLFMSKNSRISNFVKYNLELSKLFNDLYIKDSNKFNENIDYCINYEISEEKETKLFKNININKFFTLPTYKTFISLIQLYKKEKTQTLEIYKLEIQFIEECVKKEVFVEVLKYLINKGIVSDCEELLSNLYSIWFKNSTSNEEERNSFYKVFYKSNYEELNFFNNWILYAFDEFCNTNNIVTFDNNLCIYNEKLFINNNLIKINNYEKNTSFILGSSIEMQFLLYSVIYITQGHGLHRLTIDGEFAFDVDLKVYGSKIISINILKPEELNYIE